MPIFGFRPAICPRTIFRSAQLRDLAVLILFLESLYQAKCHDTSYIEVLKTLFAALFYSFSFLSLLYHLWFLSEHLLIKKIGFLSYMYQIFSSIILIFQLILFLAFVVFDNHLEWAQISFFSGQRCHLESNSFLDWVLEFLGFTLEFLYRTNVPRVGKRK